MTTYQNYSTDNTDGYNAVQLAILNQMFRDECVERGINPCDPDSDENFLEYISERVLRAYDTSRGLT